MEDDDEAHFDAVCFRAGAIRSIAEDLCNVKNPDARRILIAAADLVLQHMEPPKARIVGVITNAAKSSKEKAL